MIARITAGTNVQPISSVVLPWICLAGGAPSRWRYLKTAKISSASTKTKTPSPSSRRNRVRSSTWCPNSECAPKMELGTSGPQAASARTSSGASDMNRRQRARVGSFIPDPSWGVESDRGRGSTADNLYGRRRRVQGGESLTTATATDDGRRSTVDEEGQLFLLDRAHPAVAPAGERER